MPSHTLTASPEGCTECQSDRPRPDIALLAHAAYQDAAIVRAVRAAAGTENPVAWLTKPAMSDLAMANRFYAIADALSREIGGKP